MKPDLESITSEDFIEGINYSVDNAERLLKGGSLLLKAGNHGLANSVFILSCEESIKAFALYNKFLLKDERDISLIFQSHREKLTILKEGYHLITSETSAMEKSFRQAKQEIPNGTKEDLEKRANELYLNYFQEILGNKENHQIDEDKKWWDNANTMKQSGFYVGFNGTDWMQPTDITVKDAISTQQKALYIFGHVLQYKNAKIENYKSRTLRA